MAYPRLRELLLQFSSLVDLIFFRALLLAFSKERLESVLIWDSKADVMLQMWYLEKFLACGSVPDCISSLLKTKENAETIKFIRENLTRGGIPRDITPRQKQGIEKFLRMDDSQLIMAVMCVEKNQAFGESGERIQTLSERYRNKLLGLEGPAEKLRAMAECYMDMIQPQEKNDCFICPFTPRSRASFTGGRTEIFSPASVFNVICYKSQKCTRNDYIAKRD